MVDIGCERREMGMQLDCWAGVSYAAAMLRGGVQTMMSGAKER